MKSGPCPIARRPQAPIRSDTFSTGQLIGSSPVACVTQRLESFATKNRPCHSNPSQVISESDVP